MPGVDGVGWLPCLLLPARSSPAPWGGGLYEACGHRFRSAVRGSGVSSWFSYLVACRRAVLSFSCRHRLPPVSVLASSSCSRCLVIPYLLACLASLRDSVSARASPVVSRLIRLILFSCPCLRVVIDPRPLRPFLPCVLVSSSYRLSPRSPDKTGGALFACLSLSRGSSLSRPCLRFRPCRRRRSRSCLVALILFASPRSSTSMGGAGVGSSLLAFSRRSRLRFPHRAGVRRAVVCLPWDGGGRCRLGQSYLLGGSVSASCCVRFMVSLFVYINWVLARV